MVTINYSDIEDLKKDASKSINNYVNSIALLESIEFVKKKDGTDYVNLIKALRLKEGSPFKNLNIYRDGESYYVSATNINTDTYVKEYISGYENLVYNYAKQEYIVPDSISRDRIIDEYCRVPYYMLNTDEMNARISKMAMSLRSYKKETEDKVARLDAMYEILQDTAKKLNELGDLPYKWKDCIH